MVMAPPTTLSTQTTALLVVDMQDKLLPAIHEAEAVTAAVGRIIRACRVLEVPILVTEQYPAGLGPTCSAVKQLLGTVKPVEKLRFSACVEPVMAQLAKLGRTDILVVGIEAHVCVQQTVLDLIRAGHVPHLCADAVSSRRVLDRDTAIARMRQAGAIITTVESALFEIQTQASGDTFKPLLKIVK